METRGSSSFGRSIAISTLLSRDIGRIGLHDSVLLSQAGAFRGVRREDAACRRVAKRRGGGV